MTTDRPKPAIAPPGDAPLPWRRGQTWEKVVYADDGKRLSEFRNPHHAAYAVAAANALPGLVETCEKAEATIRSMHRELLVLNVIDADNPPGREVLDCIRAALAALPEGVRPWV
jgi:hypothetical protein